MPPTLGVHGTLLNCDLNFGLVCVPCCSRFITLESRDIAPRMEKAAVGLRDDKEQ
jgi:hypothetical protein